MRSSRGKFELRDFPTLVPFAAKAGEATVERRQGHRTQPTYLSYYFTYYLSSPT